MKCTASGGCNKEAGSSGRCENHPRGRIVPIKRTSMGHDKERSHIGKLFPGALTSVRTVLIDTLAAAVGQEHADAITNALDAYLEVEPADRLPAFLWLPPDPNVELDKIRKERDEAVARAEKAEAAVVPKKQKLRAPKGKSK